MSSMQVKQVRNNNKKKLSKTLFTIPQKPSFEEQTPPKMMLKQSNQSRLERQATFNDQSQSYEKVETLTVQKSQKPQSAEEQSDLIKQKKSEDNQCIKAEKFRCSNFKNCVVQVIKKQLDVAQQKRILKQDIQENQLQYLSSKQKEIKQIRNQLEKFQKMKQNNGIKENSEQRYSLAIQQLEEKEKQIQSKINNLLLSMAKTKIKSSKELDECLETEKKSKIPQSSDKKSTPKILEVIVRD